MKETFEFIQENRKAVIAIAIIVLLILVIAAAVICLPNMDHTFGGVWRSPFMNLFGGSRW